MTNTTSGGVLAGKQSLLIEFATGVSSLLARKSADPSSRVLAEAMA
ncbi:hypothetical protein [Kribbella deserti]|uniref:Uncharacterized protein n=1 Tax=Kribbella deserti TaxID=1926257 RepID=A0ABV6QXG7_9ACTN